MAVWFIPLVRPLLSCVIDGTFVDMWDAIKSGNWAMLGMCALAFAPGIGSVGKFAKFGVKSVEKVGVKSEKLLIKKGEKIYRAGGTGWEHGGSYSPLSMKGMTKQSIKEGFNPRSENPLTDVYEYTAKKDFYAKGVVSEGGFLPEIRIGRDMPRGEILELTGQRSIPAALLT